MLYANVFFLLDNKSPVGIYLFNVNYGNIRAMSEICSNLTIKTHERRL